MKKAYLYPISARNDNIVSFNPYTFDFVDAIERYFAVINKKKPSDKGIFDLIRYLFKIDYIFLNWVENLPDKKGGKFQTLFFLAILPLLKLLRVKIVWTLHNKLSHSQYQIEKKKLIFNKLLRKADVILTHSSEGILYGESIIKGSKSRIHYFPHPVKDRRESNESEKIWDILIWGTLSPYKGIIEFLQYIYKNKQEKRFKILIIGRPISNEYYQEILSYANETIIIKDEFIDDDSLQRLISQSRIVLFTYSKSSILSSGALMDSIGYGGNVIGPKVGAFYDLEKEGIITTYNSQEEIIPLITDHLNGRILHTPQAFDLFLQLNSWEKYAEYVHGILSES